MASLWRRENSKFWVACFTSVDGRQLKRSTKETDRRKAQIVADSFERVARERMARAHVQDVIADLFKRTSGGLLQTSSARSFFARWIEGKRKTNAKATTDKYKQVVSDFLDFLGPLADGDMNFITKEHVARFRDGFAERLSPATVNINLKCLRVFLQDAWREDLVQENVAGKVKVLKADKDAVKRRPFTVEELKRVLDAAGDSEWRGMVLFGLYTGQRLGDIASLRWSDLRGLEGDNPEVSIITRKTGRAQAIPMAAPLIRYVLEELAVGDDPKAPLFPKAFSVVTKEVRASTLSSGFHNILVAAGLATERSRANTGKGRSNRRVTNELSFHSLRHTATSMMKAAGISQAVAMDLIGHDSPAISAHYTHTADREKRHAVSSIPDVTNEQPPTSKAKRKKGVPK